MTNYSKRLDEILDKFFEVPYPDYNMGILPDEYGYDAVQERRNYEESYARDEAKQAITSLIKELVEEAKPTRSETQQGSVTVYGDFGKRDLNIINQFEQNLLKALDERL